MSRIIRMPAVFIPLCLVVLLVGVVGTKIYFNNCVAVGPDPSGLTFCESVHSRHLAYRYAVTPDTPRVVGIWIERGAQVERPSSTPLYAGIEIKGYYGGRHIYDVWEVSPGEAFQLASINAPGLNTEKYLQRTERKYTRSLGLTDFSPKYPLAHLQHYGKSDNGACFSTGINM